MQIEMVTALLHNILAFGVLWVLIFCFWRSYRVDRMRDRLFQLRYELFLMAERGEISFQHPGYWMLRVQINRLLARAHRITGLRLLLSSPARIEDPRDKWVKSLHRLPEETRTRLEMIEVRMAAAIFWQIVTGSPMSFLIALILMIKIVSREHRPRNPHDVFVDAVSRDVEVPFEKQEAALVVVG